MKVNIIRGPQTDENMKVLCNHTENHYKKDNNDLLSLGI